MGPLHDHAFIDVLVIGAKCQNQSDSGIEGATSEQEANSDITV